MQTSLPCYWWGRSNLERTRYLVLTGAVQLTLLTTLLLPICHLRVMTYGKTSLSVPSTQSPDPIHADCPQPHKTDSPYPVASVLCTPAVAAPLGSPTSARVNSQDTLLPHNSEWRVPSWRSTVNLYNNLPCEIIVDGPWPVRFDLGLLDFALGFLVGRGNPIISREKMCYQILQKDTELRETEDPNQLHKMWV